MEVVKRYGAEGGSRTRTPLRETDFKSAASAIPPPRHRLHEFSGITAKRFNSWTAAWILSSVPAVLAVSQTLEKVFPSTRWNNIVAKIVIEVPSPHAHKWLACPDC